MSVPNVRMYSVKVNISTISPKEVKTGERIEVKPGGRIPLDGILQETEASFDTSALTGESMPRTLRKGDEVLAGMIVLGQAVRIEVNRRMTRVH